MKFRTAMLVTLLILFQACNHKNEITLSEPIQSDPYTIVGEKNFLSGYSPIDSLGNVNVVIEIPTGTTEKWEVEKSTGNLRKMQISDFLTISSRKPRFLTRG